MKFVVNIPGYQNAEHIKTFECKDGLTWVTVRWSKYNQQFEKTVHISQCEFIRVEYKWERKLELSYFKFVRMFSLFKSHFFVKS